MESSDFKGFSVQLVKRIGYLEDLLKKNNISFDSDPSLDLFIKNTQKMAEQKVPSELNTQLIERYSRQMLLPEICLEGQQKLQNAKVLIIGAGGIGAPAAYYLGGAGIGKLGIVDGDVVEESNLHRQIAHSNSKLGIKKAQSLKSAVLEFNPYINIETYEEFLTPENAAKIISQYDLVLDASDNATARYLVNDACVIQKKVLVSGSALRWEGQITVLGKDNGPCYRCLYPECPKPHMMMSCGTGGVVGVVPGMIGLLEAIEAIKILIGAPEILQQRFLTFDGYSSNFKKFKIRGKRSECIVCGDKPSIIDVKEFDYKKFVGTAVPPPELDKENNISWSDYLEFAKDKTNAQKSVLLDVRSAEQYRITNMKSKLPEYNVVNIPWSDMKALSQDEISKEGVIKDKEVFVMCRRGNDSRRAAKFLLDLGYEKIKNVIGGINQYGEDFKADIPLL